VRDLNFDLELIVCPIVREPDGLDRVHEKVSRQDKPDAAFPSTPGSPATGSRRRGGRKAALHGRGAEPSNCENGLALSSRNRYLSAQERAQALVLSRALNAISAAYRAGETNAARLLDAGRAVMAQEPEVRIDYFAIVDPDTLLPLDDAAPGALVAVAAYVGSTRLIDNIIL
jgi:pantothenate synthetase